MSDDEGDASQGARDTLARRAALVFLAQSKLSDEDTVDALLTARNPLQFNMDVFIETVRRVYYARFKAAMEAEVLAGTAPYDGARHNDAIRAGTLDAILVKDVPALQCCKFVRLAFAGTEAGANVQNDKYRVVASGHTHPEYNSESPWPMFCFRVVAHSNSPSYLLHCIQRGQVGVRMVVAKSNPQK